MTLLYSFPPIVSNKSRILILGSMPGAASLAADQYYAHPRNAFWPIMGELYGAGLDLPYKKRLTILKTAGVALWESLGVCTRPGSLDSAIRDEIPNDFEAFFLKYPKIRNVYFNGAKAHDVYMRSVLPTLSDRTLHYKRLPSTSPAHAGRNFKEKLKAWRCLLDAV